MIKDKVKKLPPFYSAFQSFDKYWKVEPTYDCIVKYLLKPNQDLLDFHRRVHKARVEINRYIYGYLQNNKIPVSYSDWLKHSTIIDIFKQYNFILSDHRRGIIYGIHDAYKAYIGRNNKLPQRPCNFKEYGGIRFKQTNSLIVDNNDNTITFSTGGKSKTELKTKLSYIIPGSMDTGKTYIKTLAGGNLVPPRKDFDKQVWVLGLRACKPFSWKYQPIEALGFDANKRQDVSIAFSNGDILKFDDEILLLLSNIKSINKEISNADKNKKSTTSKDRKQLRLKWQNYQRDLSRKFTKLANDILNEIEWKKQLICIDSVTSGAKNGEFGQMFGKMLATEARKRNIPFVKVPTPHTSQRCSVCGYTHENNRNKKNKSTFLCEKCGNNLDADINASINIAYFGQYIWTYGIHQFLDTKKQEKMADFIKLESIIPISSFIKTTTEDVGEKDERTSSNLPF